MKLRGYQKRILEETKKGNTIVVLPTGSGKTFLAADLIKFLGGIAIFFVPTKLLVAQQAKAVQERTGLRVCEHIGGKAFPIGFQVLVTTPVAFIEALQDGSCRLAWSEISTVIFDEVHHLRKKHPYRILAYDIKNGTSHLSPEKCPRIIGLTASYTYEVEGLDIIEDLNRLCFELMVKQVEIADPEELRRDGYVALDTKAEVEPEISIPDDLNISSLEERIGQDHDRLRFFLNRVAEGKAAPCSIALLNLIRAMEDDVGIRNSPIDTGVPLKKWGAFASENSWKNVAKYTLLEHFYEALRIFVVSWEVGYDLAKLYLEMAFGKRLATFKGDPKWQLWGREVLDAIRFFGKSFPEVLPRLDLLKKVLLRELKKKTQAEPFRGILFVEKRISTHILAHFINSNLELKKHFKPALLYSSNEKATASFSLSPSEGRDSVRLFESGEANLLITTIVAEEGMDVPMSNCVIRFDPMHHSVSFVQGRGRARQAQSSFVVMEQRRDRPVSFLGGVEKTQQTLAKAFRPGSIHPTPLLTAPPSPIIRGSVKANSPSSLGPISALSSHMSSSPFLARLSGSPQPSSSSPTTPIEVIRHYSPSDVIASPPPPQMSPSSASSSHSASPGLRRAGNGAIVSKQIEPKGILADLATRMQLRPPRYDSVELSRTPNPKFQVTCTITLDEDVKGEGFATQKQTASTRAAWRVVKSLIQRGSLEINPNIFKRCEEEFGGA